MVTNNLFAHSRLSQTALALFCVSVALLVLTERTLTLNRAFLGYGVFILWGVVGVLAGWAVDRSQALSMVKTLIIDLVFMMVLYRYLTEWKKPVEPMIVYFISCVIITALVIKISGPRIIHYRLGQLADINPNELAAIMLPGYMAAIWLLIDTKKPWALLPAAFTFAVILLTGSRKGIFGMAVFTVVYVLWCDRKHLVRNLLVFLGLGAVGCVVLFAIPKVYEVIGERLLWTLKTVFGLSEEVEYSISERRELAETAVRLIKERPLTGWGYDCYRHVCGWGVFATYSHNNYLELLTGGGVPAFALYYAPLVWIVVCGLKKSRKNATAKFGTLLCALLVALDFTVVSYYEREDLLWAVLALSCIFPASEKDEKLNRYLRNPWRFFVLPAMRGWLDFLPDKAYLKLMYRAMLGRKPDFEHPKTFNEKMNVLKLKDRRPVCTEISDKLAVRDYIEKRIGADALLPLYGVWDSAEAIDFTALPKSFVLKTTHDSGGTRVIADIEKTDIEKQRAWLKERLKKRYHMMWRERQYENIKPRILAEKYIGDENGNPPPDYKFFCFNGKARLVLVCTDRKTGVREWYYDTDGQLLPCTELCRKQIESGEPAPFEWPEKANEMIAIAEKLSADFPLLRVDFYDENGEIRIGELTLYVDAGFCTLFTPEWDETFGSWLTLPEAF